MINVANMASFYGSRISVQASSFLTESSKIVADNLHEGSASELSLKHSITKRIVLNPLRFWYVTFNLVLSAATRFMLLLPTFKLIEYVFICVI